MPIRQLSLFLVLFCCQLADAATRPKNTFAGGKENFFVTASFGTTSHQFDVDFDDPDFAGDQSADDAKKNHFSYELNLDYRIARHLSVGIGYVDFGKALQFSEKISDGASQDASVSTMGSGLSFSGMIHTDTRKGPWFYYMRWGIVDWKVDLFGDSSVDANLSQRVTLESHGRDPFVGLGAAYYISPRVRVALNLEQYKMDYTFVDPADEQAYYYQHHFNQTGVSLTYSF